MDLDAMQNLDMRRMDPRVRLNTADLPDNEKTAALDAERAAWTACDVEEEHMWPGRAFYNKQHYTELKKFIINRNTPMLSGGPPPTRYEDWPCREDLINALMAQDKDMRFSFMNLPAELRNSICSYLLIDPGQKVDTVEKPRVSCYPNILAVNKEMNKAARNMLYANNYISLYLTFKAPSRADVPQDQFRIDCVDHWGSRNSADAVLHKPIITKVRNVNIHIVMGYKGALEDRATEIKQILLELKNYMAAHTGREQVLRITFDLIWERQYWDSDATDYKAKAENKTFIAHEAVEIMKPFTEFVEAKQYAHLLACEKTEVEFMVADDIDGIVVSRLTSMQEHTEAEMAKELKKHEFLLETVNKKEERQVMGLVTEKIIKKAYREDRWGMEDDDENHAYTLSPKKKVLHPNILDDSVTFDSDDGGELEEEDDESLFDSDDLDDGEYNLADLIKEAKPDTRIEFHPDIMEDRETKEWVNNGGFRSEVNRLRDARIARFAKK